MLENVERRDIVGVVLFCMFWIMANLTTVYTKEKDGGYTAYVVELP